MRNLHITLTKHTAWIVSLALALTLMGCGSQAIEKNDLSFQPRVVADSLVHLWAHCPVDITGDKLADIAFIHNNAEGGYLGYFEANAGDELWKKHIIAETPPDGGTFALGDMECADIDFDGDIDIIAAKHPGEWKDGGAPSLLYWYENPSWKAHRIGEAPHFIKDISLADFNKDKKMDVAAVTFDGCTLSIFQQNSADQWERVQYLQNYKNLHEGMHAGDIDGDGWADIVANAHILYNPKGNLKAAWREETLHEKWSNQTGDWSRNASKAFIQDIDGDGKAEVFISHSERTDYPLVYYSQGASGAWQENVISEHIPACHTLQVFDFDLDGDYDVLAGVNYGRAVGLGFKEFPVTIFLSDKNYSTWTPYAIDQDGTYNAQAVDFEMDGDVDILRLRSHDAKEIRLFENKVID